MEWSADGSRLFAVTTNATGRPVLAAHRPAPGDKVTRADRMGTGTLSSGTVAADGTFTINDLHSASSASAAVYVRR
ncbi:hypothetical protein AB5J49_30355 [Streptomyces sp. R28]|uniref:Uncharacterized protein n=1 Tax=Streptomyces sp. R28 TaxID=3238628 RepID=A0AB39Q3C1_9ACTN